jgi:hypothetical protein
VIQPERMQDRRVDIVDVHTLVDGSHAQLVGGADVLPAF